MIGRGARGRLDFFSGMVLAVLSAATLFWLIPHHVPGEAQNGEFAPSTFPTFAASVVFICSLALMAVNARHVAAPLDGRGRRLLIELGGWTVFAVVLLAMLSWFGFVAAGIFGTLVGVWLSLYRKHPVLIAIIVLGLPILIERGVWQLFTVNLP